MRDYDDRYGRPRRDRDQTREYARREYEYRGSSGTGGYRQDMDYDRNSGRGSDRSYGHGVERAQDRGAGFSRGMLDDMRRYAGNSGRDEDRDYGRSRGERDRGGSDRNWLDKAGDEVASWFGDEDAERRRHLDEERSHRGRGPRGYTRSDDRIREDVSDRLTDDPYVDASDIDVAVSGGEVTLTGHVDQRGAKRRAEDIAESVSGVRHVQNNLRVRQSGGTGTGGTGAGASAMAGMGGTGTGNPGTGTAGTGGAASATTRTGGKMRT